MQPTTTITTRVALPGVENEELAAHDLGGGHFVVASVPFLDTSLAVGDIVECVRVGGHLHVNQTVVKGGAETVRILIQEPGPTDIAETLLAFGCRVEVGPGGMLGASISVDAPREGIREWLDGLEAQGIISLA
ncbi:DUF4265 domain-containing protein [Corynebacterium sp. CCUG 65737]|uniref:DUF4265 domain-containing protein n=1 Tax=unclassified Corynebacterium TaxID=2624378 RepID=UPI00210E5177|nr:MULTISPECIES: DUF4265 domain-containing protein [unclassified Corynebacterium]MCQ4618865.1 DUF4265 domain-containing protein [Corynebacterium pseudogenitalium]MCQ4626040.1 DUF4265 domain-containing protein [Corynebacterium sp. CCUG 69979]MCQ4628038.1 DUF4265 domain-containing protein [Corynebacterium sp. CCUG 65737]